MDATYRADLRELNELNFARFDARLEQRIAQLDAKLEQRFAESDAKWERRIAEIRVEIHTVRADLIKWMFTFWAPTALGVIGTGVAVVTLLLRK